MQLPTHWIGKGPLPMTEHAPTRRRRTGTTGTRPLRAEVPSTIWATGPDALNHSDPWPAPIVTRAVTEFSRTGDRVLVLTPPTSTAGRHRTSSTRAALTTIEGLARSGTIEGLGDRHGPSRTRTQREADEAGLVLASLLPPENIATSVVDRIVTRAAARLTAGGVLVVFTRASHSRDGVLLDPTGLIVSAGQAADLLFLQHIAAVPIADGAIVAPTVDASRRAPLHAIAHTDVTVLLRP
ncbi:hypothetical protein [Nocardia carnea]|uniref:hypothetical protein n=1 Tax=Nocardia carnea TaxID=37328 RepID=UPI002457736A|nr:hypothetical protein [Nocardia carnea]